jgi:hypothetical protein
VLQLELTLSPVFVVYGGQVALLVFASVQSSSAQRNFERPTHALVVNVHVVIFESHSAWPIPLSWPSRDEY